MEVLTIPRLELMTCVLLLELVAAIMEAVGNEFKIKNVFGQIVKLLFGGLSNHKSIGTFRKTFHQIIGMMFLHHHSPDIETFITTE